jgi:hypothetical protein
METNLVPETSLYFKHLTLTAWEDFPEFTRSSVKIGQALCFVQITISDLLTYVTCIEFYDT